MGPPFNVQPVDSLLTFELLSSWPVVSSGRAVDMMAGGNWDFPAGTWGIFF